SASPNAAPHGLGSFIRHARAALPSRQSGVVTGSRPARAWRSAPSHGSSAPNATTSDGPAALSRATTAGASPSTPDQPRPAGPAGPRRATTGAASASSSDQLGRGSSAPRTSRRWSVATHSSIAFDPVARYVTASVVAGAPSSALLREATTWNTFGTWVIR